MIRKNFLLILILVFMNKINCQQANVGSSLFLIYLFFKNKLIIHNCYKFFFGSKDINEANRPNQSIEDTNLNTLQNRIKKYTRN